MNMTVAEALLFSEAMKNEDFEPLEIVICPPFTALAPLATAIKSTKVLLGAQNVHWAEKGAYTGEVSIEMLAELNVSYVIIGHSERRQYFHEIGETINQKLKAICDYGLKPILCIGETGNERDEGKTEKVLSIQLQEALKDIKEKDLANFVIAYEPIWAIGTGKAAGVEDADKAISYIRKVISSIANEEVAEKIRVQYGGSVKEDNIASYMEKDNVDGALIGGASLNADSYKKIIQSVQSVY